MTNPSFTQCHRLASVVVTLLCTAGMIFLPSSRLHAQVSTLVLSVSPTETSANTPLTVRAELRQGASIDRMYFLYRPFGESNYKRLEMDLLGTVATVSVPPKDVVAPLLDYYLVIAERFGGLETYPLSESADPLSTPPAKTVQITVHPEAAAGGPVLFLSPEPFAPVAPEDVLVSVSLLRAPPEVVKPATQIFLDGVDVTASAVFSGDIIVYIPENFSVRLGPGEHRLLVRLFDTNGTLQQTAQESFTVAATQRLMGTAARQLPYGVSVQLDSRREDVSSQATWYNRAGLQFNAHADQWRFRSNLFITSDEKADRQPQNRYFASVESPWLSLGYGDSYPSFPNLILAGKRLRGLNSSLKLGYFNLDLALGSTVRAVEGDLIALINADSLAAEQQRDPTSAYGKIDPTQWGKFRYGTYARNLFAIRPSLGTGEDFQWGVTWLKSKDDVTSILYGSRPQENAVIGSDLLIRFDDGKIELTGQIAFSAINSDISSGEFTDAYIDSTYGNDAQTVKDLKNAIGKYITANDNLRPLSLASLATLASEMSMTFNYFDNNLRFLYLSHGTDYNSFGQTFLRKDIRGFNISDRWRLIENQVYVQIGFEQLHDNLNETRIATTTFSNFNLAVSYYPRTDFPRFTVGFARYANTNGLSVAGPDASSAIDDATNRFFVQTLYNFFLGARHTASANVSTSTRNDLSPARYDVSNTTLVMSLTSRYTIPLQTTIEATFNHNRLPEGGQVASSRSFDYTTLSFNGRYGLLDNSLALLAGVGPTFGDVKRTALSLGSEWYALPSMSVVLQFNLLQIQGGSNDTVWGLRYRYDL
jgi:hypothetical protein